MKTITQISLAILLIGLLGKCRSNGGVGSSPPPIPSMTFIIENKTDHEAVMSWWTPVPQMKIINIKPDTNLTVWRQQQNGGGPEDFITPPILGAPFQIFTDTVYGYDSVRILLGDESRLSLPGKCEDPNNILCAANYVKTGTDTSDIYTFTIR